MSLKLAIILVFIIFQVFSISSISIATAGAGDVDSPKTATIGSNTGNISSNAAGGRFYFNLSIVSGNSYNFQLTGETDTKFDLFFFNSLYYPSIIQDKSAEYADTNSYPVKFDGYTTTNSWAFIMVFSHHIDGGTGDFILSISEIGTSTSSNTQADTTTNISDDTTDLVSDSDNSDTSGFDMITGAFTIIIVTLTFVLKRKKHNY